jgi:anti-sigma factor RsiW
MACPDELTLDLWLAGALPPDEAAAVAEHVRGCATCAAVGRSAQALGAELRAALALDADEHAFLSDLALASPWRASPAAAALPWGWLALAGVVGGYLAWLVAAPALGAAAATALQVVLGTAPLYLALGSAFDLGWGLLDLIRHPALGLSQPSLALLALALLLWPRRLVHQRSTSV